MGNKCSTPPQLYARPAAGPAIAPNDAEAATLASLASRFPALHARDVEGPELLAAPAQLTDSVFLGSFEHARDKDWLATHSIAAILNCGPDVCRHSAEQVPRDARTQLVEQGSNAERRVARARAFYGESVEYAECDATDVEGYAILDKHLNDAVAFIGRQKGPVLIHCFSGQNRSAALALGYLMTERGLSMEQALALAHPLRPLILSNESFRLQLLRLEAKHVCKGEPVLSQRSTH